MKHSIPRQKRYAAKVGSRRTGVIPFVTAAYLADILNVANCGGSTSTLNTGTPLCDVIRDIPYGLILLDGGVTFDSSDMATIASFVAALKTASRAARGARIFPIWALTNFEDKSKEPTKGALGNLTNSEIQLVDAIPSFAFQHRKGEIFHQLLAKAEAGGFTLLIIDKKYVVYGTKTSDNKLAGFSLAEFKAQLPKFQTPQATSNYPFEVTLDSITEYKENLAFVQADSTVVGVSGIRDVVLTLESLASNVAKIKVMGLGGKNVGELYSTELAAATAWVATKRSDGSAFTITSVSWDATNKRFNVTLDTTMFTALASSAYVDIDLNTPANLLATNNVDGYESTGSVGAQKP
jgi:hypothetical protein